MTCRKQGEYLVVQIWQSQLIAGEWLLTDTGDRVQVISPGRRNCDSGPDFRGATIATAEGRLLHGDIELHLRASGWKNHGHHRDPGYNTVILQVAWDGEGTAMLESGQKALTLKLSHFFKGSLAEVHRRACLPLTPAEPCNHARRYLSEYEMGRLLDEAGGERFRQKADHFRARLAIEPADEVLYQGIMRALGYTRNAEPMETLAQRLPLAALKSFCQGETSQEQPLVLEALLLGSAGLLPLCGSDDIATIWHRSGFKETMDRSCWHLFRVRPVNSPARRLSGAAHLISRFMSRGVVESVLCLVKEACPGTGCHKLESAFTVSLEGAKGKQVLIGQNRAREIAINIALPFTYARAKKYSDLKLAEHILELYGSYPKEGENEVTRHLKKLLDEKQGLIDSAQRQQGLIHLAKTFCEQGKCADCPLARQLTPAAFAA
ncbi:DUF2851 family protein [Chloroflexota bacterium]